jgi:hypothetical protein
MSEKTSKILARYNQAMSKRSHWEAGYQDCYDYALPGRTSFFERSKGGDTPEIFDETAVIGVQEFASRLQAGLTPNYGEYIKLQAGSEIPEEERDEVNASLEEVGRYVMSEIANSNFSQEANECYLDIALGTACIDVFEGDATNPIVFSAVPLPELAIDTGPRDEIDSYFRCRKMRISHIEKAYPGAKLNEDLKTKLKEDADKKGENNDPMVRVVLAVYRDHEFENEEVNKLCLFLPDHKDTEPLLEREMKGVGSSRFIGFRWSKAAGDVWGRGPLFNTMPAIKTANLVVQMILENAEMAIAGLYTAEDDGVVSVDNIRLLPGTVIPVAPGSNGLQAIDSAGRFDVGDLVLNEQRANIRKALYNETLGSTDTTPMSATEVAQRMADLSRQIGSAFGRLQIEFVNRVVQRVIYILKKQGRIDIPRVNGREIKIVSTSPLSQAQAVEDINALNNYLSMLNQHFGPQLAQLTINQKEAAEYLRDRFGIPAKINRSEEEKAQLAQQMAQMQQGGVELGEMSGQASQPAGPPV